MTSPFTTLRRRIALAGGRSADAPAEGAQGRREQASHRPAVLVERPLRHIAVDAPLAWHEDVAFLDGTQHVELVGYVGTTPVVAGLVRAAVRVRHSRRLRTAVMLERRLVVARREALERLGDDLAQHDAVVLPDDEPPHPVRDLDRAHGEVDRARTAIEIAAAREFRLEWEPGEPSDTGAARWLIADGTLGVSPDWARDPRMIGVVKSHAALPFEGAELEHYLALPKHHRSSVFAPASRQVTPLHAWALRLHDNAGRDLFYGLLRIEVAEGDEPGALADRLSRHLLAERAPLAADRRADRLLYGVHDVERFLRARGMSA